MPIKLWIYKKFSRNRNESPKYYLVYKALIYKNTFRTEGQFIYWTLYYFGVGHYLIKASERGSRRKKMFVNGRIVYKVPSFHWTFWKGDLYENGFIRYENENKEVERLQKELYSASDFEERSMIEEEISLEKELARLDRNLKRDGPRYMKRYRPGFLYDYERYDIQN